MGYSPQELADRAEIHDVIVRYGWAIDTKDWALLDTCFTADAEVDYSSNPGRQEGPVPADPIVAREDDLGVPRDPAPDVEHRRAARGRSRDRARTMVTNPQGAATREGPLHFFYVGGRYDDDFVRTPDGWKIAKRVETTLWFEGTLPTELLRTRMDRAARLTDSADA